MRTRHKDIIKEVHRDPNAQLVVGYNTTLQDLALERPEYNQAKVDVHIDDAGTMTNETLGEFENVKETDDQADLMDHFVGIFGIDVVLESACAAFLMVLG